MAKKQSIKEQREAKKAAQKQKFAAAQQQKDSVPAKTQESVEAVKPEITPAAEKPIKSRNKAAGLKATFVAGNSLYITSFGKGNTAVPEHQVKTDDGYHIMQLKDEGILKIRGADDEAVSFSGTRAFTEPDILRADNPLHTPAEQTVPKKTGQDILGLKDTLEKRYFGRVFDDNIHIQIIYNILDIEKILAVHIANVAAALDHMFGDLLGNKEDFIGYMNTLNNYEVFMDPSKDTSLRSDAVDNINSSRARFEKLLGTKRLGYFGLEYMPPPSLDPKSPFYDPKLAQNASKYQKVVEKSENQKKQLFHLMGLIGQLRQWSFHGYSESAALWLYKLESYLEPEYLETLDYYFERRFKEINKDFLGSNKVNILILKECFPQLDSSKLANLYYDFIVYKAQKNLGFSIKKLREMMLDRDSAADFKAEDMDSVRSKLYKLIDFFLFYYYKQDSDRTDKIVAKLRSCILESEKEQIYSQEATELWEKYHKVFEQFLPRLSGDKIDQYNNMELPTDITSNFEEKPKNSNASYFAKLIYVVCIFLDGKEINELLTTMLNKFDNIASLSACANELGIDALFVKDYAFFENCKQVVRDMNLVKNIARMTKPSENVKKMMFRDALDILGIPAGMNEAALDREINRYLEKKQKHDFRNFIINNVITSSRFIYVVKFCNPKTINLIVKNRNISRFVLKQIPEAQIRRYYFSCIESASDYSTPDEMINQLAKLMTKINFGDFTNITQDSSNREEQLEKERFKAVIRLYLTVMYLLVKNLVIINARYIIGFYCLERDSNIYGEPFKTAVKNKDFLALTDALCQEGETSRSGYLACNKRLRLCVEQDVANAKQHLQIGDQDYIRRYRNGVAHLSIIRNCDKWIGDITRIKSYYALYQYLAQRYVCEEIKRDYPDIEQTSSYFKDLCHFNSYVKDLVKALNAPFGYNIPRFKNLTIEELFDRNIPLETDRGKANAATE